jgi:predicted nucleic acid-binding Zn ribbon protein
MGGKQYAIPLMDAFWTPATVYSTLVYYHQESSMKLIDRLCKNCGHQDEYLRDRTEEGPWECSECNVRSMVEALLTAPKIRDSNSASFLDGTKRSGAFYEAAEANKLKKTLQNHKPAERKAIRNEIRKLDGSTD